MNKDLFPYLRKRIKSIKLKEIRKKEVVCIKRDN